MEEVQVPDGPKEAAETPLAVSREQLRLSPRAYQINVFEVAKAGNVIAVLPTGAGKTLISCLLVKHTLDAARANPTSSPKLVFFLVNLVPLVFQQSDVLRRHCDAHVKSYCGEMDVDSWNGDTWAKNLGEANIHVMTAAIFLNIISCGFVKMKDIALLILDECHHAKGKHPYAVAFDVYYRAAPPEERPKVFGMTASPIVGKTDIQAGLSQLQNAINCQIITCDENEISTYVSRAKERLVWYDPTPPTSNSFPLFQRLLEAADAARAKVSQQIMDTSADDSPTPEPAGTSEGPDPPRVFRRLVQETETITHQLGSLAGDAYLREILPELAKWAKRYYNRHRIREQFLEDLLKDVKPFVEGSDDPTLEEASLDNSPKVLKLIQELHEQRKQPEYCGIVFVERRSTAWALGAILSREFGSSVRIIVGHGATGPFEENAGGIAMDYKVQNEVIRKFRKGEITTLVATSVAEEGLDIKPCMLVVRFDLPKTLISYIQSRGRARHHRSLYLLFAETDNPIDARILGQLKIREKAFDQHLKEALPEVEEDMCTATFGPDEVLHNPETGAYLPLSMAVARLELFCSRLGGDRYYCPRPIYTFSPTPGPTGYEASVRIPSNTLPENLRGWYTVHRPSRAVSKAAAALACLRALRDAGYLDANILPPRPDPDPQLLAEIQEEERFVAPALPSLWAQIPPWGSANADGSGETFLSIIEKDGVAQPIGLLTRYPLPSVLKVPLFVDGLHCEFFTMRTVWSGDLPGEVVDVVSDWTKLVWSTILKRKPPQHQQQQQQQSADHPVSPPLEVNDDTMDVDGEGSTPSSPTGNPAVMLVAFSNDTSEPIDMATMRLHLSYRAKPVLLLDLLAKCQTEREAVDLLRSVILEDSVGSFRQKYHFVRFCPELNPLTMLDPGKPGENKPNLVCTNFCKAHGVAVEDVDPNQPVYLVRRLPRRLDFLQPDRLRYQTYQQHEQMVEDEPLSESRHRKKASERFVFPQFLQIHPLRAHFAEFAFALPSILEFLKLCLLAKELNDRNGLFFHDAPEELVPALTLAGVSLLGLKESKLERLEFLGDAHIKFFVTSRTFIKDKMYAQGSLTRRRNFLVSNEYLGRKVLVVDPQWASTIAAGKVLLTAREWTPPQTTQAKARMVNLSIKTIADTVEAVTGACYYRNEHQADEFLAHFFQLRPVMPADLGEPFILEQCGVMGNLDFDITSVEAHPKLSRVPLVEEVLGYKFKYPLLCLSALTHESAIDTMVRSYERLEFLGDAVLAKVVTTWLFNEFTEANPGTLTALREIAICNGLLAMLCVKLGLHVHLDHGSGALMHAINDYIDDLDELEAKPVPTADSRNPEYEHLYPDQRLRWMSLQAPKGLADIMESLLGAVYLDSGYDLAVVDRVYRKAFRPITEQSVDAKRPPKHPVQLIVQVLLARRCKGLKFIYEQYVDDEKSLDGTPTHFTCRAMHHEVELRTALARSKKFARREVANLCLEELAVNGPAMLEVAICDCDEEKLKGGGDEFEDEGDDEEEDEAARMGLEEIDWRDIHDLGV